MKTIRYNLFIRLFTDEKCFGPGIAQLLHRVQELHSLRAAAQDMSMAYSKAWTSVKNSETQLGCALLRTTTGGKGGGGAVLTEEAEQILQAYDSFCQEMAQYGDKLFAEKFAFWEK